MRKLLLVSAAALTAALFIGGPAAHSTDMTAKNLRPEPTLQPVQVADKDDCHYIDRAGQKQNACLPFVPVPLRFCDGKPILWGAHCDGAVTVKSKTVAEHHKKDDHDGHHKHVKKDHDDRGKDAKGHDRDDHDKYGKKDRDDRDHREAKDDHGRDGKDGRDNRGHDKKYGDKDRDGREYGKKDRDDRDHKDARNERDDHKDGKNEHDRDQHDVKRDRDEHRDVKKDRDDHDKYGKDGRDDRDHRDGKKHDRDDHREAKDDHGRDGKDGRDDRGHDKKYGDKDRDGREYGKKDGRDGREYGKKEGPKYSHKDEHGKIRFGKEEHKPFKFDRHFPGKELHGKHFVKHFRPNIKLHPVGHIKPDFVHFKPNFVGHVRPDFGHFNFKGGLKISHGPKLHHGPKTKTTTYSRSGSTGSAAMQYAGGVIVCMGTSLFIDAAMTSIPEDRELSNGEALAAVGNCIIPILGGYIGHALGDGINPCKTPEVISYSPGPGSVKSAWELKQDYLKKYCTKKN